MPRALLVDDDLSFLMGVAELVGREGFEVATANDLKQARAALEAHTPDVVIADLMLPDGRGIELLGDLPTGARTELIVITGHASVESVIEALRAGVLDYLTKPVDIPRLKSVLVNLARTTELKDEIGKLRGQLRGLGRFGRLIGVSPRMQKVYDLVAKVAPTDAPVLLTGESGTGKEIVAQTIHEISKRRHGPFLPLNCGALQVGLIESELFGHERGSFTGATQQRRGHFERASGGTLLLDEIAEMPIELQVKLLRVLETGTTMRVGGNETHTVDTRVIAATNRPPEQAVAEGKLREDLFYRLNVFPIELPPLRERRDDIPALVAHFVRKYSAKLGRRVERVPERLMTAFVAYGWPGNVRELEHVIERALILTEGEELAAADWLRQPQKASAPSRIATLEEMERAHILSVLEATGWRISGARGAAEHLGVKPTTLESRMKKLGIERPPR